MTKEKNECVPRLRFPEFKNKQWGTGILSDFISTVSVSNKIQQCDYLQHGKIAIIDQSKKYISGYTNDENNIVSNITPLIVFGDHTCIIKLINFTFAQGADGIKIFYGSKNISTIYIFYFLNFSPIIMEEYKRHFSILKNKTIHYPIDKNEQQKIADCLSSLDELIEAREQKCNALKQYKKGLMQRLFPAEGETTPRWRFPEFRDSGEWTITTLKNVATLKNGYAFKSQNYVEYGKYKIITISNVKSGSFDTENAKKVEKLPIDIQKHQILSRGDILISMTGNVGRVCRVDKDACLLNQRVGKIIPNKIYYIFLYHNLQRESFLQEMKLKAAGGAQGNLSVSDIQEYLICYPQITSEQQKIADCLSSLDDRIAAEEEWLAALREHKKGLMQQLFPRYE